MYAANPWREYTFLLGLAYFFAFWSLSSQVEGLGGTRGLYPVALLLRQISIDFTRWSERLRYFPTVLWACRRLGHVRCNPTMYCAYTNTRIMSTDVVRPRTRGPAVGWHGMQRAHSNAKRLRSALGYSAGDYSATGRSEAELITGHMRRCDVVGWLVAPGDVSELLRFVPLVGHRTQSLRVLPMVLDMHI